jgi:mannose-1-phosphate guanylyltransferase
MAVVPMPSSEKYAAVEATFDGDVRRVAGVGADEGPLLPWHFIGAHVIEPTVFDFIPPQGEQDINRTVYLAMVRAGLKVRVCPVALGAWADLGTPHRYLTACQEILTGLCDLSPMGEAAPVSAAERARFRTLLSRSWIHPSAKVAGKASDWVVIGRDAVVGDAVLERTAVLPGTRIADQESLRDTIACGELRVGTV